MDFYNLPSMIQKKIHNFKEYTRVYLETETKNFLKPFSCAKNET